MTLLFGRRARVRIAGLEIDESLRLNFEMQRTVEKTQARGQLSVYNLNPEHEQRILDRGSEIRLEAGYPETVAIICEGATQRARARRENLSRIVTVDLGDEVRKVSRLGGHYTASFVGPVPVRTIADDIIRSGLNLSPGPLAASIHVSSIKSVDFERAGVSVRRLNGGGV